MKATSKKASGLLSGLDYTAQNSGVHHNTEENIRVQHNTAEYGSTHKNTAEVEAANSSFFVQDTAKDSESQRSTAKKTLAPYSTNQGKRNAGTTPRVTVIMKDDQRKFINREARKHGLTIGEYIYGLACAASAGDISVDEYV